MEAEKNKNLPLLPSPKKKGLLTIIISIKKKDPKRKVK